MRATRILIAGCNGLLGQNLLRTAPAGTIRLGLARHATPALPDLLDTYHAGDIADPAVWDVVRRDLRPDLIVNAAAFTDVDGCERDPAACRRANRDAVAAMAATGIPLVQVSTDYVFDGLAGPYDEDDARNPLSVYGLAKREAEDAALAVPGNLVVRTAWVWGQALSMQGGAKKSFTEFVRENLAAGKPVRIVTDQYSNPTLAEDLARAIWALVAAGRTGIYHAAGADRMSRLEWARGVASFYGLDASLIEPVETPALGLPAARPLQAGMRIDKLVRDTGFRPRGLMAQLQAQPRAATPGG